ncbi:MAG: hypothetical protein AB7Q29_15905 [Vicinamibacterales bacterium]
MNLYFGALIYTRDANGVLRGIVAENDFAGPDWNGRLGTETATPRDVPPGDIAGVYCSSTHLPNGLDVFTGPLRIQRVGAHYSLHWTKPGAVPFFGVGFQLPDDPNRYCFAFYGIVMAPYWPGPADAATPHDVAPAPRLPGASGNLDTSLAVSLVDQNDDGSWSGPAASNEFLEGPSGGRLGTDRATRLAGNGGAAGSPPSADAFAGAYRAARTRPDGTRSYQGALNVQRIGDMYGMHWSSAGEAPCLGVALEDPMRRGRYVVGTWGLRLSSFWNPPPDMICAGHAG